MVTIKGAVGGSANSQTLGVRGGGQGHLWQIAAGRKDTGR